MPSPRKSSKSPARAKARSRSKSASRSKPTRSRTRSSSRGRKAASAAEVSEVKDVQVETKQVSRSSRRSTSKSPSRVSSRVKETTVVTKSPARALVTETLVTKRSFTSSSGQEQASHTPVRTSTRIAAIIEKEREVSERLREQLKSDMASSLKTPPPANVAESKKKAGKGPNYEFMGPIGAFLMLFLLPATVYYVNLACRKGKCSIQELPKLPKNFVGAFFEVESVLLFLAWFAFQAVLAVLPVGRVVDGQPLKSGGRLKYRCNGFFALVVSLLTLAAAFYYECPVTKVVDKFFKIMTAAVLFSFFLSVSVYVSSFFVNKKKLAPGGNTGNVIYDFFIGRELNPRIGPLDIKFFCELRPGLIGWVMLDWIMVIKACQDSNTLPANLVLVTLFQTLYVADALWYEEAILTTMDIIHDGFGFMLAFGDLAWVPFLYSLQPRFLLETGFVLPWYCLAPIALINFIGYVIFRASNSQKNLFRKDPKNPALADLETLPTQTSKKLLVGGWWGICRKPNYLGDLIMATAWSLTTGFGQILTYFYPLYFLVLLVHRERRDNEQCHEKYGAHWERYCQRVKYRIFPYVY